MRHSLNQHKAQAFHASREIDREAQRIVAERGIPLMDAYAEVFGNPEKLKACHDAAPRMGTLDAKWTDPRNEPQ